MLEIPSGACLEMFGFPNPSRLRGITPSKDVTDIPAIVVLVQRHLPTRTNGARKTSRLSGLAAIFRSRPRVPTLATKSL
jgi:hypothetical protein